MYMIFNLFSFICQVCRRLNLTCILFVIFTSFNFIGCIKSPPYPPSNIIKEVTFAPISSVVKKAEGSDNWPITWCDDDNQYTAYGDGWGFEPKTGRKLSLGFSRIIGSPKDFHGFNVRSVSGEREGDGEKGPKASGMLMVDGVLYMWIRNTYNSMLAWSKDYAKSWQWGFRFRTSFGCPTFLNFRKNYQDVRDDYVYVYSQDGPDAYKQYDQVVMARVPKRKITESTAYQFFERLDSKGNPLWTSDIKNRGGVFKYDGHYQRIDVVYNPYIERYLMAIAFNFKSGWGIYDAPEPWGPWTKAFYTNKWDISGIHSYRLPTKWIDPNGKSMNLVFSGISSKGYDAFCVRKMFISLHSETKPVNNGHRLTF